MLVAYATDRYALIAQRQEVFGLCGLVGEHAGQDKQRDESRITPAERELPTKSITVFERRGPSHVRCDHNWRWMDMRTIGAVNDSNEPSR